jgi:hypothetical protein
MTATTPEEAQVSLDRFWETTGDARLRPPGRYAEPGSCKYSVNQGVVGPG